jgi:hypothetical protein
MSFIQLAWAPTGHRKRTYRALNTELASSLGPSATARRATRLFRLAFLPSRIALLHTQAIRSPLMSANAWKDTTPFCITSNEPIQVLRKPFAEQSLLRFDSTQPNHDTEIIPPEVFLGILGYNSATIMQAHKMMFKILPSFKAFLEATVTLIVHGPSGVDVKRFNLVRVCFHRTNSLFNVHPFNSRAIRLGNVHRDF